jgi:hypothetical protein
MQVRRLSAVILVAMAFVAGSARADAPSKLDQLKPSFDSGVVPDAAAVGTWSGRCFWASEPNRAYAALFVVNHDGDAGPLFPYSLAMALIYGKDTTPDAFDKLSAEQLKELDQFLTKEKPHPVQVENGSWSFEAVSEGVPIKQSLRKFGAYYYSEMVTTTASANGKFPAGYVSTACYYFNKVR